MVFSVWLGWRNTADLDGDAAGPYDPASPCVPPLAHARCVPCPLLAVAGQVAAVRTWLTDAGFDIVDVPDNRLFVTASGTVAGRAHVRRLREPVPDRRDDRARAGRRSGRARGHRPRRARDHRARRLARARHSRARSPAPPPPAGTSVGPCSHYWGEHTSTAFPNPYAPGTPLPWLICGYTPAQIDSAYGIDRLRRFGLDGRGQTIAITGAFFSPTIRQDANELLARVRAAPAARVELPPGDRARARSSTRRIRPRRRAGTSSRRSTSSGRTRSRPARRIVYVGAANDAGGLDQAVNDVVDHHLANIVSNSWGLPESLAPRGEILAMNAVFQQAAAEGIGVYFASGDDGDNRARGREGLGRASPTRARG